MKKALSRLSTVLLIGIMAVAGITATVIPLAHATSTITPVAGQNYSLYAGGISSTATSITVTSFKYPATTTPITTADLGTVAYATLEPGNATRQEIVSFTGVTQNSDGTATLTGVTRGLQPRYPYTTDATLKKQHPGGSILVLSNPPQLYNDIITYINQAAFAGAPDASTIVKGLVELATGAEISAGTATGNTGPLGIPASLATSTYNSATAANRVVVTGAGGFIDQGFLPSITRTLSFGSGANLAFSGTATSNIASSSWVSYTASTTPYQTYTKPQGLKYLKVWIQGPGGDTTGTLTAGAGSGTTCMRIIPASAIGTTENVQVGIHGGTVGSAFSSNSGTATTTAPAGGSTSSQTSAGTGGGACTGPFDLSIPGKDGNAGINVSSSYNAGGEGADSLFGHGGGMRTSSSAGSGVSGQAATGNGAGASGAACASDGSPCDGSGASGSTGAVFLEQFFY